MQSTDSMSSLSNYQSHSSQNYNKIFHNSYGNTKDPEQPKQSWERMELEESTFLTSDYTSKLQSSRQYGAGTKKKKYRPMEQDRRSGNKPMHLWESYF